MTRRAKGLHLTMLQQSRAIPPSVKASYHLGEGRVDRDFFELSPSDEEAITARIEQGLDAHLEGGHA